MPLAEGRSKPGTPDRSGRGPGTLPAVQMTLQENGSSQAELVRADKSSMESQWGAWRPRLLLALGMLSTAAYVMFAGTDGFAACWYLATAALGTGMAIAGAWTADLLAGGSGWRWRWVRSCTCRGLPLGVVRHRSPVSPYPSWAERLTCLATCSGPGAVLAGAWAEGRPRPRSIPRGSDSHLGLRAPATMFFILPIFSRAVRPFQHGSRGGVPGR